MYYNLNSITMKKHLLIITLLIIILSLNAKAQDDNLTNISEPTIICSASQCDSGCVKCSDNKCYNPGFTCEESLEIESITPEELDLGKNQLNILVRNSGNVDLTKVYAEVTGSGITMIDNDEIAKLVVDDTDYAFVRITAEKPGKIDLAIKLYSNSNLIKKDVQQITILGLPVTPETLNKTEIENNLNTVKERYKTLERDYQNKKSDGYPVEIVFDDLKSASTYLKDAQFYLLDGDLKKANVNTQLAIDTLDSVESGIKNAKKEETSFGDKIKSNLLYIGSIAAALISILTAYKLTTNYVNKQKISDIHHKIKTTGTATFSKGKEFLLKKKDEEIPENNELIDNKKEEIPEEDKKKDHKKKK